MRILGHICDSGRNCVVPWAWIVRTLHFSSSLCSNPIISEYLLKTYSSIHVFIGAVGPWSRNPLLLVIKGPPFILLDLQGAVIGRVNVLGFVGAGTRSKRGYHPTAVGLRD